MKIKNRIMTIAFSFILLATAFTGAVTVGNQIVEKETDPWQYPIFQIPELKVISISFTHRSQLQELINHGLDIVDVKDSKATAYITDSELTWICESGFKYEMLFENLEEMNNKMYPPELMRQFHNYATMTSELQDIANTYSSITNLYDLGSSVQGRTIWGLKITDDPDIEENEPEVRICGCHHGDEFMSVELPLLLAWHLVENYASDPYIEDLVDNREIWIIPMVNPDGREASTRRNANGVDLNRDYGYMWDGWGSSPSPFSQPETQVIRDHALDNNFVLSLSFHTSGDIVNYIWNYKGQPVPDNDVVVALSQQYGSHNGYWVVEGYDWYQTCGDTNDFSYGCCGDIDWTIEVQNSNIPGAWDLNRDAMIEIIDAANMGLTGTVTDAYSGDPIAAAVWVEEAYWPCFTDPTIGDYHKTLLPGTYNVHFRANGYEEQVFTVDVTDPDEPTVLDVSLNPDNEFYAYQVTWCNFYDPYGYPNNFQNNPTEAISALGYPDNISASTGVGGTIVLDMGEGTEIFDLENEPDFKIYEGDDTDDGYHVYVSSEWDGPWTYMGLGMGTTEFDLATVSIESAQYVKIVDDSDGNPYEMNPGVDINAILNLAAANANKNPEIPDAPSGPTDGVTHVEYTFTVVTTDPEEDPISYMFDWGDGTYSDWIGPVASGTSVEGYHAWIEEGNYEIKVKARDEFGESGWSTSHTINIVEGPSLDISAVKGGLFKIAVDIENNGAVEATGVNWKISLDGGAFIGKLSEDSNLTIAADGIETVNSNFIIGFGPTVVTVDTWIPDGSTDVKELNGFVFLFLINIRPGGSI
ncbi:MAG: carboxypeptidase regulatory-like domain-containing protein [Thermoplasmatales archaeon]|nr:carboxypeptidase regulatory-like domain-containing protein [Thermoplasmatales archaeon]